MRKKLKIILFMFAFSILIPLVEASNFTISVGNKRLIKGGKTTLKIKADDLTGRLDIQTSNASVITISEDRTWIENDIVEIQLSALGVGSATITVIPSDVSNYDGKDGKALGLKPKSIKISVALPREKSTNNYLKSLAVTNYELVPAFDKNTVEYSVSVPPTVDKIQIAAEKENTYATIQGVGEFEVKDGLNTFEIVCQSETGQNKVYIVSVTVEDLNPIEVKIGSEIKTLVKNPKFLTMPLNFETQTISISGINIPAFHNDKAHLTLVGLKDKNNLVQLYCYDNNKYERYLEINSGVVHLKVNSIKTIFPNYQEKEIMLEGEPIQGMATAPNSDFVIINGTNLSDGQSGYYVYDQVQKSLQRYDSDLITTLTIAKKSNTKIIVVLISLLGISFVLIIILMYLINRYHKLYQKLIKSQAKHLKSKSTSKHSKS